MDAISPTSGPASGGTVATLSGTDFGDYATVTIGGVAATGVDVTSSTSVGLTVPALAAGELHDVSLTNPDLQSGTLLGGWFADFLDVPQADNFHAYVEKLIRNGVTAGCGGGNYCRDDSGHARADGGLPPEDPARLRPTSRRPAPARCFGDVPCTGGSFDPWIEDLAGRDITGGCGGGNYCPGDPVTRAQMSVFLLKTELGRYMPPACTGPIFADVPCTGAVFAPWIEELAARGITGGCTSRRRSTARATPTRAGRWRCSC